MKTLIASLMVLVLSRSLALQPIFVPHKGERPLLEFSQWSNEDHITNRGEPCAKYFIHHAVRDQDVLALKVPVTEVEERRGTLSLIGSDMRSVLIKLDDEKRVPTAEWVSPKKDSLFVREVLIRISRQDYDAAPCLTGLNPS